MRNLIWILIFFVFVQFDSKPEKINKYNDTPPGAVIQKEIIGKWKVIKSTFLPFEHLSHCEELELNSIFEFTSDKKLIVYQSLNGATCNKNQTFKIEGKKLKILENGLHINHDILELTSTLSSTILKLKIKNIPYYFWDQEDITPENYDQKYKEMKEKGIVITLQKL